MVSGQPISALTADSRYIRCYYYLFNTAITVFMHPHVPFLVPSGPPEVENDELLLTSDTNATLDPETKELKIMLRCGSFLYLGHPRQPPAIRVIILRISTVSSCSFRFISFVCVCCCCCFVRLFMCSFVFCLSSSSCVYIYIYT